MSQPMSAARTDPLADPSRVAVLTMELQRGVCGDQAALPQLADAVSAAGLPQQVNRLCVAARQHRARVVHCTVEARTDAAGRVNNNRLLAATADHALSFVAGTPGAELLPTIGAVPADVTLSRLHGLTPFTGTSLDQVLRNMGIETVVCTGVSINVGVLGMVLSASDLGYQVIVPSDAVIGVPQSYADAVLRNTISLLATVTSVDEILARWS